MIARSTFKYLILCTNLIWLGGATNFRLIVNGPDLRIHRTSSPFRKIYQWTNKLVNISYVIFVAYRLIQIYTDKGSAEVDPLDDENFLAVFMQTAYVFTCYLVSVLLDIQTLLKGDVIPFFILEYVKVFRQIGKGYLTNSENKSLVKCNAFLTTLLVVGNTIYVQNFILMRKKPWKAHFLSSSIAYQENPFPALKIILILVQCWVWWNLWANIYFYIFNVYIYICCAIRLIRELT